MRVGTLEGIACCVTTNRRDDIRERSIVVINERNFTEKRAGDFLARHVKAVVNMKTSHTGEKVTCGVERLVNNGIPVFDVSQPTNIEQLKSNHKLRIVSKQLYVRQIGKWDNVASVKAYDIEMIDKLNELAEKKANESYHERMVIEIEKMNTHVERVAAYFSSENVSHDQGYRPIWIVERYSKLNEDLALLKRFMKRQNPYIVAINDSYEDLVKRGIKPDVLFGTESQMDQAMIRDAIEKKRKLCLTKGISRNNESEQMINLGSDLISAIAYGLKRTKGAVFYLGEVEEEERAQYVLVEAWNKNRVFHLQAAAAMFRSRLEEDPLHWMMTRHSMLGADGWI
ncbi:hypothetical protein DH09_07200 [Bacillaceae bacterium JMAK1]|nr:hypothetical protein DH09_07200 [Bacillaceae bacterium JMAK1]